MQRLKRTKKCKYSLFDTLSLILFSWLSFWFVFKYDQLIILYFRCRGLSDMNGDGKMDFNEFSVACKLINLKLKGMELPKTLPPQVINDSFIFSSFHPLFYSFIHLSFYPPILSFIHLSFHPLILSSFHPLILSSSHPFIY